MKFEKRELYIDEAVGLVHCPNCLEPAMLKRVVVMWDARGKVCGDCERLIEEKIAKTKRRDEFYHPCEHANVMAYVSVAPVSGDTYAVKVARVSLLPIDDGNAPEASDE